MNLDDFQRRRIRRGTNLPCIDQITEGVWLRCCGYLNDQMFLFCLGRCRLSECGDDDVCVFLLQSDFPNVQSGSRTRTGE